MDCTTGLLSAFLNYNNAYGYHTLAEHIYLLGVSLPTISIHGAERLSDVLLPSIYRVVSSLPPRTDTIKMILFTSILIKLDRNTS